MVETAQPLGECDGRRHKIKGLRGTAWLHLRLPASLRAKHELLLPRRFKFQGRRNRHLEPQVWLGVHVPMILLLRHATAKPGPSRGCTFGA